VLSIVLGVWGCEGNSPDGKGGDLGAFFAPDAGSVEMGGRSMDLIRGEAHCFTGAGGELDLSVVGQMFEMSFENLFPGEYVGNVLVKVKDLCGNEAYSFEVGDIGSFAFHLPVGDDGFHGYFEFPYRPEWMAVEDYPFADYPLFREFDKPFNGDYIHCNLRLFAPDILSIPLTVLKQKETLGYIQGTLYEWVTYDTIAGAKIQPSSGTTTYISDAAHLPDSSLTETQTKGLFLVANCTPGPVVLTVHFTSGAVIEKTVHVWPLNSEPNDVITNVGIPVTADLL